MCARRKGDVGEKKGMVVKNCFNPHYVDSVTYKEKPAKKLLNLQKLDRKNRNHGSMIATWMMNNLGT